jgi:NAD(P)-dependent dehydrogenase (short-subunit alcohol dehydrogenase family)
VTGILDGKSIVVTGAGRGIGRSVALLCANEGANVVVADLGVGMHGEDPSSEVADAVVAEIRAAGGNAVARADSVTDMAAGARIVQSAIDNWGSIDGVVCVAGILRERMLFNMSEDDWDAVIATHLKGTFTIFRAAAAIMRAQQSGSLIGFTSASFQASVAQANYSAAKGGIVSLVRSAAAGLHRYGVTANAVAPIARTRMMAQVPMDLPETGEPEDVAPMVAFLLSDRARHITGQIYTVVGGKIAVWNQPREVRAMYKDGRWTAEEIAQRLDSSIGQEPMPILAQLEEYRRAAAAAAQSGTTPNA